MFARHPLTRAALYAGLRVFSLWGIAAVAATPAQSLHDQAEAAHKADLPNSAVIAEALQALYGKDAQIGTDKTTGQTFAIWKATPTINIQLFPHEDAEASVISSVILALPISIRDSKEHLVLTESGPYSTEEKAATNRCHACAGVLGGILLKEQSGSWRADVKSLHIATFGAWGQIPNGQLILIGPDKYGIRFDLSDVHQGDTDDEMVIVGIVGGEFKNILEIATGESDEEGTCEGVQQDSREGGEKFDERLWCYEFNSNYQFVAETDSGYYDLVIRYWGTKADFSIKVPVGMKISDVSRTETYRWDGKGYKLVSSVKTPPQ